MKFNNKKGCYKWIDSIVTAFLIIRIPDPSHIL